jgi:hypothetical protein
MTDFMFGRRTGWQHSFRYIDVSTDIFAGNVHAPVSVPIGRIRKRQALVPAIWDSHLVKPTPYLSMSGAATVWVAIALKPNVVRIAVTKRLNAPPAPVYRAWVELDCRLLDIQRIAMAEPAHVMRRTPATNIDCRLAAVGN